MHPEIFYSVAAQTYVVSAVIFAAVRWFHCCNGCEDDPEYYYPDRKLTCLFYLIPIVLLVYVVEPLTEETKYLVRGYYPLTHFYYCAALLLNYFGTIKGWRVWKKTVWLCGGLVFSVLAVLFVLAFMPGEVSEEALWTVEIVAFSVGVLMMGYCAMAMMAVWKSLKEIVADYFSNPDVFPTDYARMVLYIPILHAVLIWPVALSGNMTAVAWLQIVLSVFNVAFLIYTLPSYRKKILEADISTDSQKEPFKMQPLKIKNVDLIVAQIRKVVEDEKAFLNPHLTVSDVAARCDFSRTYVSKVIKEELGGFYKYVNSLRFRCLEDFQFKNPNISLDAAIEQCGFVSRSGYYNARKYADS